MNLLQRLHCIDEIKPALFDEQRRRKLFELKLSLLEIEPIKISHVAEIKDLYYSLLGKRQGYLARLLEERYKTCADQKALTKNAQYT